MYVHIHLCCADKVGHILKLGLSTRLFLLQGPEEDMEEESELTVTQLKEKRQLELAAKELEELEYQQLEEERLKLEEEQGIDWGMGEFTYIVNLNFQPHYIFCYSVDNDHFLPVCFLFMIT
jgi:hypothetical protein